MRAAAIWLAIALALAAILSLPLALHAAEREVKPKSAPSLVARNMGAAFRIYSDQPCSKEALASAGASDGEFYRRAEVIYQDKTVDACWLTLVAQGTVTVYAVNLNVYEIPLDAFRPETKA